MNHCQHMPLIQRGFILWLALVLAGVLPQAQAAAEYDFFESKIRPVLVEHCYKCHSREGEKIKGGLLLDTQAGMLKGGDSGRPAIVPGDAEHSLLITAIRHTDEDLQMPREKLSDAVIADFVTWVNAGAPDPRKEVAAPIVSAAMSATNHWAFQPVREPAVPEVRNTRWPQTPIDRFILAKLEEKNLKPSSAADKRTLIRRVTYDLTGLPPSVEEVEAFLKDRSKDAFAKVVDRLLASPRYGERWGRYWLDVARYADTKGYVYSDREESKFVHAHAYRDWVIRALNEDMPYDRFVKLQLAADQLVSKDDPRDLAALGFLTVGRRFLGVVHEIIDDRIDVVTRGLQGLTVSCARCHDHKFDPVPTQDYYSLYGVFAGSYEEAIPLNPKPEPTEAYLAYEKGLKEREQKYADTFQAKKDIQSARFRAKVTDYLVALLDVEKIPSEEFYAFVGADDVNPVVVRQWQTYLFQTSKEFHPVFAPWHALAKLSPKDFAAQAPETLRAVLAQEANGQKINPRLAEALQAKPPQNMTNVAQIYGELLVAVDKQWQEATKAAKEAGQPAPTALPDTADEALRQILHAADSPAAVPAGAMVDMEWFFDEPTRVEVSKLQLEIDRWNITAAGAPPHAVVLTERSAQKNPRVFRRGNPASKGDEVPRQYLQVIAGAQRQPFANRSGRLEMAEAIASPNNPLTARVMVNRVWQQHFGVGLVKTPSDFGTRSEPPSHPELLDWLSARFMEEGWSLKKLHRQILLSSVYQQGSASGADRESYAQVDPENRLLWRMNRQRLDFESMRDSLLLVSGELDLQMGGRPVEIFAPAYTPRRTIYGFLDRQFLPGVLRVFDFANPDMHSPQRHLTTVPQQALFFLNSPFLMERARALVARPEVQTKKNPRDRIEELYQLVYQHQPTRAQVQQALRFFKNAEAEPVVTPKPIESAWQYGYGEFDEAAQRVKSFEKLPHFTGDAWQGGEKWPDAKLGWAQLTATGGHTGDDMVHAVIRRWVAPRDLTVSIESAIKHERQPGNGVRARIVSSRAGVLHVSTVHHGEAKANLETVLLKAGDTLDFVVDHNGNLNNDDFRWVPVIKVAKEESAANSMIAEWNAEKEFGGTPEALPEPLQPWEQYAQVLLLGNEFVFVD